MKFVWLTIDAINMHLDNINFPLGDDDALNKIEADFAAGTHGGFWRGQVGAISFRLGVTLVKFLKLGTLRYSGSKYGTRYRNRRRKYW